MAQRRKRPRRPGIFLITTLILVMFLVILGSTLMASVLSNSAMSGTFEERQLAMEAANAGATWVQSHLEDDCTRYSPGSAFFTGGLTPQASTDGSVEVDEGGGNIVGIIRPLASGDTRDVAMVFRICWNGKYGQTFSAANGGVTVGGYTLPTIDYISMNNLNSPVGSTECSYRGNKSHYHTVPGASTNVIVAGYAIRGDGIIRSTRFMEISCDLSGLGGFPTTPTYTNQDTDIANTLPAETGGKIVTGVDPYTILGGSQQLTSFTSNSNINIKGKSAAGATEPPGYSAVGQTYVGNSGDNFTYQQVPGGATTDYNTQYTPPKPPTLTASDVRQPNKNLQIIGGTWALFNGRYYHYPTNFLVFDQNNNVIPPSGNNWSVNTGSAIPGSPGAVAPLLNGVAPDRSVVNPFTLAPGASGSLNSYVTLDNKNNAVTLSGDVTVVPDPGLSTPPGPGPGDGHGPHGGGDGDGNSNNGNAGNKGNPSNPSSITYDPNSIAIVVAPPHLTGTQTSTVTTTTTDPVTGLTTTTTSTVNTSVAADNSFADGITVNMNPASGSPAPVFENTNGNFTLVGTTTGKGAIITDNQGDITVQGKSALSPEPDTGIALVSGGNINLVPTDDANPQSGVADPAALNLSVSTGLQKALNGSTTFSTSTMNDLVSKALNSTVSGSTTLSSWLQSQGYSSAQASALVLQYLGKISTISGATGTISNTTALGTNTIILNNSDQQFGGLLYATGDVVMPNNKDLLVDGGIVSTGGMLRTDAEQGTFLYGGGVMGSMSSLFGNHVQLGRSMAVTF